MIERYFTIKNFRSIGVDEPQHFDLSYLMTNKGSYGGVVTIIGENNSGKSNVLAALKAFGSKSFTTNDFPFHNLLDGVEPEISLFMKDHVNNIKARVKIKGNKQYIDVYENDKLIDFSEENRTPTMSENSEKLLSWLLQDSTQQQAQTNHRINAPYQQVAGILQKLFSGSSITQRDYTKLDQNLKNNYLLQLIRKEFKDAVWGEFLNDVKNGFITATPKNYDEDKIQYVQDKFNLKPVPRIIEYLDTNKIKRSNTISQVTNGNIQNSQFFEKLYELLEGHSYEEIKNAYKQFHESGMQRISILTNYSKKVNRAIEKLSNQFNEIYTFNGNHKYGFRLRLDSNNIYLMISENDDDIYLDSQSTGFRWFFDFFFNVFADKKIEPGDIVILDEPATNLHVSGQIELRKQIKEFGIQTGITFVMSTHSPFLIDPDYLDEVRIVSKEGLESRIKNKFTVDDKQDLDVMMPIKAALTVNRHILLNPDDTLIFVEGVTDYNYLVMIKKLLGVENLTFMPIQGIKRASLHKDLLKITKYPILLVDSDKAGKYAYEKFNSSPGIEIIRLEDIDSSFIEIENLFAEDDAEKYSVKDKDYKASSALKNAVIQKQVRLSAKTKANLKSVVDRLIQ
jgi:predicted ATPase